MGGTKTSLVSMSSDLMEFVFLQRVIGQKVCYMRHLLYRRPGFPHPHRILKQTRETRSPILVHQLPNNASRFSRKKLAISTGSPFSNALRLRSPSTTLHCSFAGR